MNSADRVTFEMRQYDKDGNLWRWVEASFRIPVSDAEWKAIDAAVQAFKDRYSE